MFARGVTCFPEEQLTIADTARREMAAFDRLSPEARAAFREAHQQQFSVCDVVGLVQSLGALPAVREAFSRRGLLPYQVEDDGVVAETVRQLDARHTGEANRVKGI